MTEGQAHEYDPMSLQSDIDAIYTSRKVVEHLRASRSISQETTMKQFRTNPRFRIATNIWLPELFGEYGGDLSVEPPTAPTDLR